jgi:RimJ/RimL family protein N-acetyltransferase
MMADDNRRQFILMDGCEPVGQIRLDLSPEAPEEAEISYAVAPKYRGRGYGSALIRLVEKAVGQSDRENLSEGSPAIALLEAKVLADNTASAAIFERMGYKKTKKDNYLLFTKEI